MSNRPVLIDSATSGLGGQTPPRLSIDMNRFTLIDGSGNEKLINALTFDVVFIGLNPKVSKIYYDQAYEGKDKGVTPRCFSDNGVAPSMQADTPQAQTCAACPHNVIGSAISKFSGAKIKECVDYKKLAFIVPGDQSRLVYLMTIKPGSFKNWTGYVNWLKTQAFANGQKPDLYDVITRLSFESQGVLKFEPAASTQGNTAVLAQMEEAWGRNVIPSIVGQDDVPFAGQLAAPVAPRQIALPSGPAQAFRSPETGAQFAQQSFQPSGMRAQNAPNPYPHAEQMPPAEGPKKRGPKPKAKDMLVENVFTEANPPPPAGDDLEIPPFLQRGPAPTAQSAPSFGMAPAQEPDADMQSALDEAFKLPT